MKVGFLQDDGLVVFIVFSILTKFYYGSAVVTKDRGVESIFRR